MAPRGKVTGTCRYTFNPSERYRDGTNGDHCGAVTYAITDVPDMRIVPLPDGSAQLVDTGLKMSREIPDPYCPQHGGTPDPDAPAEPVPSAEASPNTAPAGPVFGDDQGA
jgi:hypothetical protein